VAQLPSLRKHFDCVTQLLYGWNIILPVPDAMALSPTTSIVVQTSAPAASDIALCVVLPTYQRPEPLARTLQSLMSQTTDQRFAVIIVENHAAGLAGADMARTFIESGDLVGAVLVEQRQGNCFAYNAGFRFARDAYPHARFVAVIDDDEVAGENWLAHLLGAATFHKADLVGGPQVPRFEDANGARAFGRHPVFQPTHHASGPVALIHSTGNCLINTAVIDAMGHPVLDEAFNFTGGGDTDFFTRCAARGYRFAWSNEAEVFEMVPPRRSERGWITARSLRNGMLSALIQKKAQPGAKGRLRVIAKSLALLAAAPFRTVSLALKTGSLYAGSYHMLIAAGRVMAEFGYAQEQYRQPEKN
jgi:GT2 family glycosyltransferase